jgi:predicted DNA-binding antitoxin AbrB/MazE fold protein
MPPIEAIYQNGVFRPIHPVELPEGARVQVSVIEQDQLLEADQPTRAAQPLVGEELAGLLDQIAALPYTPHPDGRTDISTHHDEILYPNHGEVA